MATIGERLAAKAAEASVALSGETLAMLEAFCEIAHLANPQHTMLEFKADALKRAIDNNATDAAFGVVQSRRLRAELRLRFQDFAAGWDARRVRPSKPPPTGNTVVAIEMSATQGKATRTALRYFLECWEGVIECDPVVQSAKVALLRVRAVVGSNGEECYERRAGNGG
jgi:hypothetical protein